LPKIDHRDESIPTLTSWSNDPESYADGSLGCGRVSHARPFNCGADNLTPGEKKNI